MVDRWWLYVDAVDLVALMLKIESSMVANGTKEACKSVAGMVASAIGETCSQQLFDSQEKSGIMRRN